MDDDDWMELADVARLLGRTERQVLRYGKDGKVATRRVGRRFQYRRDEVERLAGELEPLDATRHDSVTPDVGRALVEVVNIQRELILAERELRAAEKEITGLQAQLELERTKSARYMGIIKKLIRK